MPELPEVETIARTLEKGAGTAPGIVGMTVTGAEVFWVKTVEEPAPEKFKQAVLGQVIQGVGRRGKYLVISLDRHTLLIHLRMSGDVLVGPAKERLANHIRLTIELDYDWQLAFNNPRKFGRVWLLKDPEEVFKKLGPEPLDPALNAEEFWERLQKRKRQIKPLMLDQSFIAGMGNIYTDEALNIAKIHPQTRADQLTLEQAKRLLEGIRRVLRTGIHRNGASIDWVYRGGEFQNYFRVYQQTGEPCPECGTPVERIVVGQRGTHFCPSCQILQ